MDNSGKSDKRARLIIKDFKNLTKDEDLKNTIPMLISLDADTLYFGIGLISKKYKHLAKVCKISHSELNSDSQQDISLDCCFTDDITVDAWYYIRIWLYYSNLSMSKDFITYTKENNLSRLSDLEIKYGFDFKV